MSRNNTLKKKSNAIHPNRSRTKSFSPSLSLYVIPCQAIMPVAKIKTQLNNSSMIIN